MNTKFAVGQVAKFAYPDSFSGCPTIRVVTVEKVGDTYIQGYDSTRKNYRTFSVAKITEVVTA